jgi:hypothetical protein
LLREWRKPENVLHIDIAMILGRSILKYPVQCFAEDIQFPIMHASYLQMIHLKFQHVAPIESFALLGRLLICEDMTYPMKLMSLLR